MATKSSARARSERAKAAGRKGGLKTALTQGSEFCRVRAVRGGEATRDKYGNQYYAHITKFKKKFAGWQKGRTHKSVLIPAPTQA